MKYYVYCRKSTEGDEKQALSLQAQLRELNEYCAKNKLAIVSVLEEEKSARTPGKRPLFLEMLERIKQGDAEGIVVWHTSRLSRNPQESGVIMQMLTDGVIKEIRTPQMIIDGSSSNDILLGVEFGTNSQYSKDLSYNTKRGIREKIIIGQYPSFAPAFYLNYGLSKKNKNIKPDPETSQYYIKLIDEIIARKLNTVKATALLRSWGVTNRFGRNFSKNAVYNFLRNPVYYGLIRYKDYPENLGTFKPLIAKDRWEELQDVLGDMSKPVQLKREYAFTRLIKCGKCGLSITGTTKEKKTGIYRYYACTKRHGNCGNPPIKESDLDLQLANALKQIRLTPESVNKLKIRTLELLDDEFKREKVKRHEVSTQINELSLRLDKLLTMRLEGEINKGEYLESKSKINDEINYQKNLMKDVRYNRDEVRNQLELFFENIFNLEKVFNNGTYEEKHLLIQTLVEDLVLDDKKLGWNFRKPYDSLIEVDSDLKNFNWGQWLDAFWNFINPNHSISFTT
jgi:DNA invertase Pin-like site-specific DNA recombinase